MVKLTLLCLALSWIALGCESPKCEPITGCDVRSESCQRSALKLAACLRGSPADSKVRVEIVDYDTYVDEQVRDAMETDATQDEVDLRDGLARFELSAPLDREADARRDIEWVGAFYDAETDRVTVLDRGESGAGNERGQTILLVHEMTHALQGADGLFDTIYDPVVTYDGLLAAIALVEGEATLVEDHSAIEALGFHFEESHYGRALKAYRRFSEEALIETEDLFVGVRSGIPYAFGASFLYDVYRKGGAGAVRDQLDTGLVGTRELLGRSNDSKTVRPAIPLREQASLVGSYHLGGFFFDAFLRRIDADAPDVQPHVLDDVFSVQRLPNGKLLAAWRLRFDESVAVEALEQLLRSADVAYRFGSEGSDDLWILREADDSISGDAPTFMDGPEIDVGFSAPEANRSRVRCARRAAYNALVE